MFDGVTLIITQTGQAIHRQSTRARRLHQGVRARRGRLLPEHDLADFQDASGVGAGARQVR